MTWKPTVYPEDGATGLETLPEIIINFPIDLDEYSLSERIVLVKVGEEESTLSPISCNYTINKEMADGTAVPEKLFEKTSGINTIVKIKPKLPLEQNSKYSVILGKDLQERSVFSAKETQENTGKGQVVSSGNYSGNTEDIYVIEIQEAGDQSNSYFKWTRLSDGIYQEYVRSTRRSIEIDRGIFVKFLPEEYKVGDEFRINVYATDKLHDLYSWNFSTGTSEKLTPPSESSKSVISFPVADNQHIATSLDIKETFPADRDFLVDLMTHRFEIVFSEPLKAYEPEELKKLIKIGSESLDQVSIQELDFTCRVEGNKIVIELETNETT